MTKCEKVIKNLLSAIFEWADKYSEEINTRSSEVRISISKQDLPCQNFLAYLLLVLKRRAINPDDSASEFQDPQIRYVIDEYYHSHYPYYGNPFDRVYSMRREEFPEELMKYIVLEWEHGEYKLEYFLTVLKHIGTLLFDSKMMVQGLLLAEKKLKLDKGTLVEDWEYLLSLK